MRLIVSSKTHALELVLIDEPQRLLVQLGCAFVVLETNTKRVIKE